MRGRPHPQRNMLVMVDLEERVSRYHPLRRIKEVADAALERLSPTFDRMICPCGPHLGTAQAAAESLAADRPVLGAQPARLLRGARVQTSVPLVPGHGSDGAQLRCHDLQKNRQRLLAHDAGWALLDEMVWAADEEGLLSDEHFNKDEILIEAAASLGASDPRRDRCRRRMTIPAIRPWTSGGSTAATLP